MFEDVDRIESMTAEEYRQVIYYLNHPKEYDGDYVAFREKILEFGSLPDIADRFFIAQYNKYLGRLKKEKKE